ncbi:MAG: dihydrolipoamide acetyltransferase family protein [Victivallaceae bacterium]
MFEFIFPKMGETGSGGIIVRWLKKEGELISVDEAFIEISTDKITAELPSSVSGRVAKILYPEGEEVFPGTVLALVEPLAMMVDDGVSSTNVENSVSNESEPVNELFSAESFVTERESVNAPKDSPVTGSTSAYFSPAVLNLALREGISMDVLRTIPGTGGDGRLTRKDLDRYLGYRHQSCTPSSVSKETDPSNLSAGENRIPMSPLRKAIASSIARSSDEVPHASLVVDIDVTDLMNLIGEEKTRFMEAHGVKLTITSFILQCLSQALGHFPLLNGSLDGSTIVVKRSINVGVAVNLNKEGVVVPVIRNCQDRCLVSIAKSLADLSSRARIGKLDPWEVKEGTVTVTNFGMTGALIGMPIIRHPEVAILGIGTIQKRVVVRDDDSLAIRKLMYTTLTFDHRVLDGIYGSEFLTAFKNRLESVTLG